MATKETGPLTRHRVLAHHDRCTALLSFPTEKSSCRNGNEKVTGPKYSEELLGDRQKKVGEENYTIEVMVPNVAVADKQP